MNQYFWQNLDGAGTVQENHRKLSKRTMTLSPLPRHSKKTQTGEEMMPKQTPTALFPTGSLGPLGDLFVDLGPL